MRNRKMWLVGGLITILAIAIMASGCGGGSGTAGGGFTSSSDTARMTGQDSSGQLTNNAQDAVEYSSASDRGAAVKESGALTVTVQNPGMGITIAGDPYSPGSFNTLRLTVPGKSPKESLVASRSDIDPLNGGSYSLSIQSVPAGAKVATIEVLNSQGKLLAMKKLGFSMTAAGVKADALLMGLGIDGDGACTPSTISVPAGTTLLFENYDTKKPHTITLNAGAIVIGPLAKAQQNADGSFAFNGASYTFTEKGTYSYVSGYGAPGFIEVIAPPSLSAIADGDGNDIDLERTLSPVNFTLTGSNYGDMMASSSVSFTNSETFEPIKATLTSWGNTAISGTVNLAEGRYLVTITANGQGSRDTVYYFKGISQVPFITSVEPASLKPGDLCVIKGHYFGAERGADALRTVNFSGINASAYNSWSDSQIECVVPDSAPAGNISVTVTVDAGAEMFISNGFSITMQSSGTQSGGSSGYTFITSFGSSGQPESTPPPQQPTYTFITSFGSPGQ